MNELNCTNPSPAARRAAFSRGVRAIAAAFVLSAAAMFAGAVEVKGGGGNVSLSSITGTPTLVTVVLKTGQHEQRRFSGMALRANSRRGAPGI